MKTLLIAYATREGQTRRIAEHLATYLLAKGFEVDVLNVEDHHALIDLYRYAGVILAASVHVGRYEPEMVAFVEAHQAELDALPAAFLSVSMAEAEAEEAHNSEAQRKKAAAEVQASLERFFQTTGWHPKQVQPIAGALMYSRYNFLLRLIMKQIAKRAGASTDTHHDHVYTNWVELDRFAEGFASALREPVPPPDQRAGSRSKSSSF